MMPFTKRLIIIILCLNLTACAALSGIRHVMGGMFGRKQSGGTQVHTNAAIGDNKKKTQVGNEQHLEKNEGTAIAGDQKTNTFGNAQNIIVHEGSTWSALLIQHGSTALLVTIFLFFFGYVLYNRASPQDKRLRRQTEKDKGKLKTENEILNNMINKIARDKLTHEDKPNEK